MRRNSEIYFWTVLGLFSLLVCSSISVCQAQAKPAKQPLQIENSQCGRATLPVMGLLLAAGKTSAEERDSDDDPWFQMIAGGNMALIDTLKEAYPSGKIPAVAAWAGANGLVSFILKNVDYAPKGYSVGLVLHAMAKLSRAEAICEKEAIERAPKAALPQKHHSDSI